nr:MAG TPA: hypothetical protein [Microviridae sp.]
MSFLVFVSRKRLVRNERTITMRQAYFNFTGRER